MTRSTLYFLTAGAVLGLLLAVWFTTHTGIKTLPKKQVRAIEQHQAGQLTQAARDTTRAARADTAARTHYRAGQQAERQALTLHRQAHAPAPRPVPDTAAARLQRQLANY